MANLRDIGEELDDILDDGNDEQIMFVNNPNATNNGNAILEDNPYFRNTNVANNQYFRNINNGRFVAHTPNNNFLRKKDETITLFVPFGVILQFFIYINVLKLVKVFPMLSLFLVLILSNTLSITDIIVYPIVQMKLHSYKITNFLYMNNTIRNTMNNFNNHIDTLSQKAVYRNDFESAKYVGIYAIIYLAYSYIIF
jgi:hypothetical protein